VVERFADQLDALEDEITTRASPATIGQLHAIRNDFLLLRRSVRPHREAVNELIRDEHPLITQETRLYLRDCYDHTVQLMDLLEVYRESCSDLRDYYLSIVSNRMNEIMKVLTIISTIFMPLSFIAGVYGMNFDTDSPWNMPELGWKYGYVFAWSVMLIVAAGLVGFIWRRGWLRPRGPKATAIITMTEPPDARDCRTPAFRKIRISFPHINALRYNQTDVGCLNCVDQQGIYDNALDKPANDRFHSAGLGDGDGPGQGS